MSKSGKSLKASKNNNNKENKVTVVVGSYAIIKFMVTFLNFLFKLLSLCLEFHFWSSLLLFTSKLSVIVHLNITISLSSSLSLPAFLWSSRVFLFLNRFFNVELFLFRMILSSFSECFQFSILNTYTTYHKNA